MDDPAFALLVRGVNMPVHLGPGHADNGIAFGQREGAVFVTITRDERALTVQLEGDVIDLVAGLFADAISAATRADLPSPETVQ